MRVRPHQGRTVGRKADHRLPRHLAVQLNINSIFQVWSVGRFWLVLGQMDADCQTFNGFCHWQRQYLALVVIYRFWINCLHEGNFPVPPYQAILVNFVNLSTGTAILLLDC